MPDLERVRELLDAHITNSPHTYRELSLKIGRKDCYIQQYIKYGFPKRLSEIDRKKLCLILNIDEESLIDDELRKNSTPDSLLQNIEDIVEKTTDCMCVDIYNGNHTGIKEKHLAGRMTLNRQLFKEWFRGGSYNMRLALIDKSALKTPLTAGGIVCYDADIKDYEGDGLYLIRIGRKTDFMQINKLSDNTYAIIENNKQTEIPKEKIEFLGKAITLLKPEPL